MFPFISLPWLSNRTNTANSLYMQRNCTVFGSESGDLRVVYADIGLAAGDAHTQYTENPDQVALSAFLDFLFLMDASVIIGTRSSFSGTVASVKGLICSRVTAEPGAGIRVCIPRVCSPVHPYKSP